MALAKIKRCRIWSARLLALLVAGLFLCMPTEIYAQVAKVTIVNDDSGTRLQVDGKDFMINGMNWDYFPIGTNYSYSLWSQPDEIIKEALDAEMSLLRAMGVNAIRQYTGIQPKWVEYIYKNYGIFTVLNHSMGRYGVTLDGAYIPSTDYSDPKTRAQIVGEIEAVIKEFKNTPGVLMWLLGNENNYGLTWSSAETEALPEGERNAAKAKHLYSLYGESARAIKAIDTVRPVAMANGDVQYIDLIAQESMDVDIFGTNVYRGRSMGDLYQVVKDKTGMPVFFTEFGADAYHAREQREDQFTQASYLIDQWQELYEQSAGKGRVGNCIGGLTFQFSDGWWKYLQDENLDVHDINASWPNNAYPEDMVEGGNNMNEEWWGICAKGPTDARGLYKLYPRAAYYALMQAHQIDVYAPGVDIPTIQKHFANITAMSSVLAARGDKAALQSQSTQLVRVSGVRMEFETFSTGGNLIDTPEDAITGSDQRPGFQGFDHLESYYAKIEANPAGNVSASVTVNLLGNVPNNPIDEIFYENRGLSRRVLTDEDPLDLNGLERLKIYNASINWSSDYFNLEGFYRTGHYHWGYEGDFFGLYPEANYGPNIDTYNGEAPLGFELEGKRGLNGLKVAFGPELWWGANPTVILKYQRKVGPFVTTAMFQEDVDEQGETTSSFAVPVPKTRKATLHLEAKRGSFGLELGGIWAGKPLVGRTFQIADGEPGSYQLFEDQIKDSDTFGGKAKLTYQKGKFNWYAQGAAMGLVAQGGWTQTLTYTGWHLKDSGSGNQWNFLSGLTYQMGNWQIAPNFLWQKPIEGPVPSDAQAPGRPRNIIDDPFAVRANRETTAGELLLTYDPTPQTWMYAWDSDVREDSRLAASLGFIFRSHKTSQDAAIGIFADGRSTFAFPGAPPARDLWEAHGRIVSKLSKSVGFIANLYGGQNEPNGDSERLVERFGADVRFAIGSVKLTTSAKVNDWGPYDYHRDFNLTFPLQLGADISNVLGKPDWFDLPATRLGMKFTWRSLDEFSPRYCPTEALSPTGNLVCDPTIGGFDNGSEWEIRTYLHMNLGM